MTPRSLVKKWGGLAAEVCGSLLLVLALYWLFMLFLYALFPSGTPLQELMQGTLGQPPGGGAAARAPEATLSRLLRDVRFRRGNSIAWGGASEGMQLFSQDAVQTLDRSGAKISFGAVEQLQLGSNSLVVVTRLDPEQESGERSYRVKVDGDVKGSLSGERKLKMELEAAGHVARIAPGKARFRVARNGSDSASLSVYDGEARLMERGREIRVQANYGVMLKKGAAAGAPVRIPSAPQLTGGERGSHRYRLLPPQLRFAWSGAAKEYHFQLSSDPAFKECLVDKRVDGRELMIGKLEKGSYYWRVSGVNQGVEGSFSRVGLCELRQLLDPPELRVDFPPARVAAGSYTLTGTAPPGSRIFVDGGEVALGEGGGFTRELRLKPGVNLIRVEALDPAGNARYLSRIVYGGEKVSEEAPMAGGR